MWKMIRHKMQTRRETYLEFRVLPALYLSLVTRVAQQWRMKLVWCRKDSHMGLASFYKSEADWPVTHGHSLAYSYQDECPQGMKINPAMQ
jgi:hypothetical protein